MRRLTAAVLVLTVASVSAAALDGGTLAGARSVGPTTAAQPPRAARFAPLPAMAPALAAAVAQLLRPRTGPRAMTVRRMAPNLLLPRSGTCYVGAGACSEHPCAEYAVLRAATAVISGRHRVVASPHTRCFRSSGQTRVLAVTSTSVTAAAASSIAVGPALLDRSR